MVTLVSAALHARASGCEWLHVDFEEHLTPFYFDACGFRPTRAGLIRLSSLAAVERPAPRATGAAGDES